MTEGKFDPLSPMIATSGDHAYMVSGAWAGSQRKRPRCASFGRHCFAATRSAFSLKDQRHTTMIYTFLIAAHRGRIADIPRIRTLSVYATSEAQARANLAGLPLVFLSRCQASAQGGRHHG